MGKIYEKFNDLELFRHRGHVYTEITLLAKNVIHIYTTIFLFDLFNLPHKPFNIFIV